MGSLASITAVGFALTAYAVGVERNVIARSEAMERTLTTLRFFWDSPQSDEVDAMGYMGFFYHFLDMETGPRDLSGERTGQRHSHQHPQRRRAGRDQPGKTESQMERQVAAVAHPAVGPPGYRQLGDDSARHQRTQNHSDVDRSEATFGQGRGQQDRPEPVSESSNCLGQGRSTERTRATRRQPPS